MADLTLTKEIYKRQEVLQVLSISASTFHRLVNEGKLKALKLGRATIVKKTDLFNFINSLN